MLLESIIWSCNSIVINTTLLQSLMAFSLFMMAAGLRVFEVILQHRTTISHNIYIALIEEPCRHGRVTGLTSVHGKLVNCRTNFSTGEKWDAILAL